MIAPYATEFIFYAGLYSQADSTDFQNDPTLTAGDAKITTDGGAEANLGTLPAVTPASSRHVKVTVSAAELTGKCVHIHLRDAAGAQWIARDWTIHTTDHQSAQYPNGVVRSFTAQAGAASTITLDSGASATDNIYMPCLVVLDGGTGSGQWRMGVSYAGSTKILTVAHAWGTNPDSTSTGKIYATIPALYAATMARSLALDASGIADANVQKVNDVSITGNGSSSPFNV